jgi:hypothetical protein
VSRHTDLLTIDDRSIRRSGSRTPRKKYLRM